MGLKRRLGREDGRGRLQPQSNQRGIETILFWAGGVYLVRLNRTSVGLKLGSIFRALLLEFGLNRTSVGLKPVDDARPLPVGLSLNRTSVGLKPRPGGLGDAVYFGLNRTSVGLKRTLGRGADALRIASIEPAWD